jgi:hypothetical protein
MIREPTGWVAQCEKCWAEISSDDIDECYPRREDEFIEYLKNQGWVVDEKGEVYCCENCLKAKQEDELEGATDERNR